MTGADGTVVGLVLAAGEGRRMGRPKALLTLGGERLVDRAVRALTEGGATPAYVVAGAAPLQVPGAVTVTNPDWASGLASSLRAGLGALAEREPAATAAVVSLVDQPGIGPEAVARVVAALRSGAPLAVATYDGAPRNPVGIARHLWTDVARRVSGDAGARGYLAEHPGLVTSVECGDVADPADLDTPDDLAGLTGRDGR